MRYLQTVLGGLALSLSACTAAEPLSELEIAQACRLMLNNHLVGTDQADWSVLPKTFTQDTVVTLRDGTYDGLEELTADYKERDPQPNIIHHLTSASFKKTSETTATGKIYILIQGELPMPDGKQQGLLYSGFYTDEYVMTDGACKITKRKLSPRFMHRFAE